MKNIKIEWFKVLVFFFNESKKTFKFKKKSKKVVKKTFKKLQKILP